MARQAVAQRGLDLLEAFLVVVVGLQEAQVAAQHLAGLVARQVLHGGIDEDDGPVAGAGLADGDAFRGGIHQALQQGGIYGCDANRRSFTNPAAARAAPYSP